MANEDLQESDITNFTSDIRHQISSCEKKQQKNVGSGYCPLDIYSLVPIARN